jgi:hypothetical protein
VENIYSVLLTAPTSLLKFCEPTETTHHGLINYKDTKAKCRWRLGIVYVKGTVSQDFLLQVFFINHLPPPPAPENKIRVISNFFKNSRTSGITDSKGKYSPGVNGTGGKLPLA